MDELSGHARALLEAARDADDPTPATRARADAAARLALARFGLHDLPALPEPLPLKAAGKLFARTKLSIAITLSLAGLGLGAALFLAGRGASEAARPVAATSGSNDAASESDAPPEPSASPIAPSFESAPTSSAKPRNVRAGKLARAAPLRIAEDDSALQRELEVLAEADDRIRRGSFDAALQLLDESGRGAQLGRLVEERLALRVLAQCGKSADERALRQREHFLRIAPRSVLATRVREACVHPNLESR